MRAAFQERICGELANWILDKSKELNFTWDWWACFTTDDDHEWRADHLSRAWEKYVASHHPNWAYIYVIEPNKRNNGTHIHVIIGNTKNDSCVQVNHQWKEIAGNMWSKPFNLQQIFGCSNYILKYMFKGKSDFWNIKLPDDGQRELTLKWARQSSLARFIDSGRERPAPLRRDRPGRLQQLRFDLGIDSPGEAVSIGGEVNELFRALQGCKRIYSV